MATEIVLKEGELTDIAKKAIALDASMSDINAKLQRLYSQLDNDIVMIQKAGTHITYGLPEISKNIQKQSQDMTSISTVMSAAGEKAVSTNQLLTNKVEGVKAISMSMGTGIAVVGIGAALGSATSNYFGVNANLGSTISTVVSNIPNILGDAASSIGNAITHIPDMIEDGIHQVVHGVEGAVNDGALWLADGLYESIMEKCPGAEAYGNELLASGYTKGQIYNMVKDNPEGAKSVLVAEFDRIQRQQMQDRYNQLVAKRGSGFYGKCGAYTYQQLVDKGIASNGEGVALGKDYYATWTARGTTKTGYSVESYGGTSGLDSLVAAHKGETISNIAVSFNQYKNIYPSSVGHVLLIDKIIDGKVYFSENSNGSLWSLPERTKYVAGEPLCLTIEQFKKQYPQMNGVVYFHK